MDYITIGQILKAQGIKGEIKIRPLTDMPTRYKKLKLVYIENAPYKIMSCRITGNDVFLILSGIDDRDKAAVLRDKFIQIDRVNAVDLDEGTYFICDVVGCKLLTDKGAELGEITDVAQYGAADVITAVCGSKTLRFPFLKKLVKLVDISAKTFTVIAEEFDGVCVYDD